MLFVCIALASGPQAGLWPGKRNPKVEEDKTKTTVDKAHSGVYKMYRLGCLFQDEQPSLLNIFEADSTIYRKKNEGTC